MALLSTPNFSLLETNGTSGYQPFTLADVESGSFVADAYDAILVKSDNPLLLSDQYTGSQAGLQATFTGTGQSGFNSYSASAPTYVVANRNEFSGIPAPTFQITNETESQEVALVISDLVAVVVYTLERSTDLADPDAWSPVATFSGVESAEHREPISSGAVFYRLVW